MITGAISASVGLVIKQTYSQRKRRKELDQKIFEQMARVDNVEKFLKEKLGFEEFEKIKEPLKKFEKREITQKELIKAGK